MSKKSGIAKLLVGATAVAVAGKVVYDKYKILKDKFEKEENDSIADEVKKYNAVCTNKMVEVEDEEFSGCEIKAVASKLFIDLSLAVFEKDVYINFKSDASMVTIVLPEGVNAICDIENVASGIKNLVENVEEDGIHTVFIIGKATMSSIEVIPAGFYADEEDYEDDSEDDFEDEDYSDYDADEEADNTQEAESEEILEVSDEEAEDLKKSETVKEEK